MVGEVTVIFMDTSNWMGHNQSHRFLEQADAIELYCKKKLRSHPDNHVGIFATAHTGFGTVVEPTRDLSKIMNGVCGFTLVGGYIHLKLAISLASYRCFNLIREHKYKNLLKRILVFAGGYLYDDEVCVGRDLGCILSNLFIAVDVVNFGTHREEKLQVFEGLVEEYNYDTNESGFNHANKINNSCRLLRLSRRLDSSLILCLVGEGRINDHKRRRDDSRDMHGDGKKELRLG